MDWLLRCAPMHIRATLAAKRSQETSVQLQRVRDMISEHIKRLEQQIQLLRSQAIQERNAGLKRRALSHMTQMKTREQVLDRQHQAYLTVDNLLLALEQNLLNFEVVGTIRRVAHAQSTVNLPTFDNLVDKLNDWLQVSSEVSDRLAETAQDTDVPITEQDLEEELNKLDDSQAPLLAGAGAGASIADAATVPTTSPMHLTLRFPTKE